MKALLLSLVVFTSSYVSAQGWAPNTRKQTGTWQTLNVKYELLPKVNVFAEAQFRSQEFYNDLNYWEAKTFFHYTFSEQFAGGLGIGTYHQYADYENFKTPQKQTEARVWAEFTMKSNGGRINFDHRFRFEDRFIRKYNSTTDEFYGNHTETNDDDRYRFRYRLQSTIPLNHKTMVSSTFYLSISDEIMFTQKLPFFNQNRLYIGTGYKFKSASIQVGLMHQFLHLNNTDRRKDYLQITFSKVIHRTKK